MQQQNTRQAD